MNLRLGLFLIQTGPCPRQKHLGTQSTTLVQTTLTLLISRFFIFKTYIRIFASTYLPIGSKILHSMPKNLALILIRLPDPVQNNQLRLPHNFSIFKENDVHVDVNGDDYGGRLNVTVCFYYGCFQEKRNAYLVCKCELS